MQCCLHGHWRQVLEESMEIACTNCTSIRQSYWIIIFGGIHFFLSQLPNFNSVSGVSLAAAVMSLSVTIGHKVMSPMVEISFALEIQATIPSTPQKPSKVPMWHGVLGAYFINALCYFPVALIGYWAFDQNAADNVFAIPVFDLLENFMIKRLNFPPGMGLRLVVRSTHVAFTLFLEVTFPFFGFFGGFGFAQTSSFASAPLIARFRSVPHQATPCQDPHFTKSSSSNVFVASR
ncbi:Lysine histidine transporter-like 6-like protein [Drosera capensis]